MKVSADVKMERLAEALVNAEPKEFVMFMELVLFYHQQKNEEINEEKE